MGGCRVVLVGYRGSATLPPLVVLRPATRTCKLGASHTFCRRKTWHFTSFSLSANLESGLVREGGVDKSEDDCTTFRKWIVGLMLTEVTPSSI